MSINPKKINIDSNSDNTKNWDSLGHLNILVALDSSFGGKISKIKEMKNIKLKKNLKFDIEVDGGIDFNNSKLVVKAGANILVSGTTIFKNNNGDIKKNIETLKSI